MTEADRAFSTPPTAMPDAPPAVGEITSRQPPHPDASLLLNISRLGDIIAEVSTSRRRGKDDYLTSIAQHAERYVPLDQRVEDTPALTSEGARAKLALVQRVYSIDRGWWMRFGGIPLGAVQDALRLGISPGVPDCDAELIQACADFDAAQAERIT